MVSSTQLELAEWISVLAMAGVWSLIAWLVDAARILREDSQRKVNEKHKETRFSSTISVVAMACFFLSAGVLITWTGGANTTKTAAAIKVEYFRWIGIGLFIFFLSWAYANYSSFRETDWRMLQVVIFFAGVAGTLATLVPDGSKLQVVAYVFTGFLYAVGALNAIRYTNIKTVGFGYNYIVWLLIFICAPFIYYLLLIFGPEGTKVENTRWMIAIGYLVVSVFTSIVPGLIIAFTFMKTKKLSMDVLTYMMRSEKSIPSHEMESLESGNTMITDQLVELLTKRD